MLGLRIGGRGLSEIGISLPVQRWKSHILTVAGELVSHVTAWLDGTKRTLVPYRGRTFIANARRVAVDDAQNPRACVPQEIAILEWQLAEAYPNLHWRTMERIGQHGCLKTEFSQEGIGSYDSVIFDAEMHGIAGLTVVFPGKASLAFTLAQEAVERMINQRGETIQRSQPVSESATARASDFKRAGGGLSLPNKHASALEPSRAGAEAAAGDD